MKLGRRTVYAFLLAIVCLNLLVRFPRTDHEVGVDSFAIHYIAAAIMESGYIPWVLNPLGYFGWYPLAYPTAGPLLISGLALAGDLSAEGSILVLAMLYGALSVPAAFMMARAFRRDDFFALAVAVVFSLAPRFMSFTLWSASTRNLFMVLIPIFLWALVRTYRKPTSPNLTIMVSVLVLMLATHRLTILLAVVVLAFVVAYVFVLAHRVVRLQFPRALLSQTFRRWAPRLAIAWIAVVAAFMLVGTDVLAEYSSGEICSGDTVQDQVCNLGVSITRSVGLALPLALVGIFEIVRQHNKGFLEAFLVLSLLALIPTLFLRQYTGFYILPFLALFAGLGIVGMLRFLVRRPRAWAAAAVVTLVAVSGFSVAVLEVEVERGTSMTSATYTTALFVRMSPEGNFVANDGLLGVRVSSVSGRGGVPIGGAGTTSQSPELLIMGAIDPADVVDRERRIPLTDLTIEDDSPFILAGIDARGDWIQGVLGQNVNSVSNRILQRYSLRYLLENDAIRSAFAAYGNVYYQPNDFALSVHALRYKIYDGTSEDLYLAFPSSPRS